MNRYLQTGASILGILLLFLPWMVGVDGLGPAGEITFGIFLLAAVYWVFEPIPIYATSLIVILLQVLLLSDQGVIDVSSDSYVPERYQVFYGALASPIIILFLGGFTLAAAAVKYGIDKSLTRLLIQPFGSNPKFVCLGMMLSTGLLSAFMSNTATTAMMMTMVIPVIAVLGPKDPFRKGVALSIPIAANIGGVATPIGSPPNAIALTALKEQGIAITFSTWMLLAMPLVLVMLVISWRILVWRFPPSKEPIRLDLSETFQWTRNATIAVWVFVGTALLWITEALHGVSSTVVAFIPLVVLTATGALSATDIRRYPWEVLWLVAGGLSMGVSLKNTGLAEWLIGLVAWENLPVFSIALLFVAVAYSVANLVSNTVTASLLIPLATGLGAAGALGPGASIGTLVLLIGIVVSFSMMLPVSTPPNAIAMSTQLIKTKDMATAGALVGIVAVALCVLSYLFFWPMILG